MPFTKGKSGNPAGRRPGQTPAAKLRKTIGKHSDELVEVLLKQAREGDVSAAKALLDKLVPNLKPQGVATRLPIAGGNLTDQGKQVIDLMADGHLATDEAAGLLNALSGLARLQEVDELTKRIDALEAAAKQQ